MYIRLIDSTPRENEYLFRLNDQQKVYYSINWRKVAEVEALKNPENRDESPN